MERTDLLHLLHSYWVIPKPENEINRGVESKEMCEGLELNPDPDQNFNYEGDLDKYDI